MQLIVIRHATAVKRETFVQTGQEDSQRPLTEVGSKRMRLAASGLRSIVPVIDLLGTSPLVRAAQTAKIVSEVYGGIERFERVPELSPGNPPASVVSWMQKLNRSETVAIVGHEPDLGILVSWLLSGTEHHFHKLKKGAACLLDFPGTVAASKAELVWALRPAQLRSLGK